MPSERLRAASHLFTVRLWHADLGNDQVEWRGQVTHVLSGESHYFREWLELETVSWRWLHCKSGQVRQRRCR